MPTESKEKLHQYILMKPITINGNLYQFTYQVSLYSLLEYLGFQYNLIVLDYNGTILPQEFWSQTFLHENDSIEILTIAGGG